jgi:replicative DNA helicase
MPGVSGAAGNGSGGNGAGRGAKTEFGGIGDRLPPQNLEAERSLLGSILLDNEVLHDVVGFLQVQDFYRDAHQIIYSVIRDMYDKTVGIDVVTLSTELDKRGALDKIGGDETLEEISASVPHAANAKYYAEIVKEKAVNRQLIESATEIIRDGYSNQFTADQLLEAAERKIYNIREDQIRGEVLELKDVVKDAMDAIAARADSGGHAVTGLATGFMDLDDITSGLHAGQLVIIAARPSMGKTAIALNICDHAAFEAKTPVLFTSLEMGYREIAERLMCSRSRVDGHKIRTGIGLGMRELTQLTRAYNILSSGGKMFIDDTPARNMMQIAASARRIKRRHGIGLIVIDYIQLVDSEEMRDSRQEQIAKISRRLKTLARDLNVPVVALSQLNRAVETREDKRPRMADLRESGAIEQDADIVLLLHRPEYYEPTDQPGVAELIVAKNRNGATNTIKLTFVKNLTRFENFTSVAEPFDGGSAY